MRHFVTTLLLGPVLLGFMLLPAKADMFDKKTVLTVHESIQIPGMVLDPGTYVMKRTIPRMNPDIISFWNADEDHVLATVKALPIVRPRATGESVFLFDEARGTEPKALKVWYYPGEVTGAEFLYDKRSTVLTASLTGESEVVGGLAPQPEPAPAYEPQAEITTAVPEPQRAEEPVQMAQARPTPEEETLQPRTEPAPAAEPETLPATAGILPLLALLGAAAAVGGAGLKRLCK